MANGKQWGLYGSAPACEHLITLLRFLMDQEMDVWSEHGEEPSGWVNVNCHRCNRTYETTLDPNLNRSGEHDDTERDK